MSLFISRKQPQQQQTFIATLYSHLAAHTINSVKQSETQGLNYKSTHDTTLTIVREEGQIKNTSVTCEH